jgi:hypothetical protein
MFGFCIVLIDMLALSLNDDYYCILQVAWMTLLVTTICAYDENLAHAPLGMEL